MNKKILTIITLFLIYGCTSPQLTPTSEHGFIVFSTSLVPGCDNSSYFNNASLFLESQPTPDTGFNSPMGHISGAEPFNVKNVLYSTDFGSSGVVHIKQIDPGTYYFTTMHASPIAFVHHKTEDLKIRFDVRPGSIQYLGSISLGTTECADASMTANIGSRTILKITDELSRDIKIAQKNWQDMPGHLVKTTLASHP